MTQEEEQQAVVFEFVDLCVVEGVLEQHWKEFHRLRRRKAMQSPTSFMEIRELLGSVFELGRSFGEMPRIHSQVLILIWSILQSSLFQRVMLHDIRLASGIHLANLRVAGSARMLDHLMHTGGHHADLLAYSVQVGENIIRQLNESL
jgi:hypothetical protein